MDFIKLVILYTVTTIIFFGIDLMWLGVIAKNFYRKQLAGLLRNQFNLLPAVIFYLIYIIGLMVFVVIPAINNESFVQAAGLGALFGIVAYATYDLSNLATINNWSIRVVIADILWGMTLSCVIAVISYLIGSSLI